MHTSYLSPKAYSTSCDTFLFHPYREGALNFQKSGNERLTFGSQIKHLSLAFLLITPGINVLALLILRTAIKKPEITLTKKKVVNGEAWSQKYSQAKGREKAPIEKVKIISQKAPNQLKKEQPKEPPKNFPPTAKQNTAPNLKIPSQTHFFSRCTTLTPEESIKHLADCKNYQGAWDEYKKLFKIGVSQAPIWDFLPPKEVITFIAKSSKHSEIPLRLLKDCALTDKNLLKLCFSKKELWERFSGHIEYLRDLFESDANLALRFIRSDEPKETLTERLHYSIACSALNGSIMRLKKQKLTLKTMRSLTYFLLIYRFDVSKRVYDKVKELEKLIRESQKNLVEPPDLYSNFFLLIDLVIHKYKQQYIYSSEKKKESDFYDQLFSVLLFDTDWENIADLFTPEAQKESSFPSIETYFSLLSFVSKKSPYFSRARKLLGNIERAKGNLDLAENYFIEAENTSN